MKRASSLGGLGGKATTMLKRVEAGPTKHALHTHCGILATFKIMDSHMKFETNITLDSRQALNPLHFECLQNSREPCHLS